MAKKYRVAVIGHSKKGKYGHALDTVWRHFDNVEIVAVADPDEAGRADAAKRLGAKASYADFRQMLDREKPQIVSAADRFPSSHRDMVVACAQAGAHIFLEKPMARTLAEADEMIKACETHHVKLAIAHQTRYSPRLKHVKDLIAAGDLGDILELHGRGKEDTRGGGQDLMVLGTHVFDLMRLIAGDARWCHAQVYQGGAPATKTHVTEGGEEIGPIAGDRLHASYGFDGGVLATFGSHKARKEAMGKRFGLHILGSKGVITTTTGSLPQVWFLPDPTWRPGESRVGWKPITSAGLDKPETLRDGGLELGNRWIVEDLFEAIEKDRQPRGSMYDGRAALEMIMAVYESHRAKAVVPLPLKTRAHPLTLL